LAEEHPFEPTGLAIKLAQEHPFFLHGCQPNGRLQELNLGSFSGESVLYQLPRHHIVKKGN